jgi:hypothetical protein
VFALHNNGELWCTCSLFIQFEAAYIIISGSTVLVRTLAASHKRFCNFIKTHDRTPLDEWPAYCTVIKSHQGICEISGSGGANMKIIVFRDVASFGLVEVHRRLKHSYWLHQDDELKLWWWRK